ncbi:hypothetical protein [Lysobacter sp. TAB13]|uniref:hypothetical protein n=1 Tax=Lysobacter sp. TAB13 TaxID=3233065 RepID=UPI003F960BE7
MNQSGPRSWIFWLITAIYVASVVAATFCLLLEWPTRANEWGDVFAGVFSPLAFLWLLYAALAQRSELELQRAEIKENNETQAKQQAQMARQADALEAQAARLRAQADAEFQPVFILDTSGASPHGTIRIDLMNVGAAVLDVSIDADDGVLLSVGSGRRQVRDLVISYWKKDESALVDLPMNGDSHHDKEFRLTYTRLDGVSLTQRLLYLNAAQRVSLLSIDPV